MDIFAIIAIGVVAVFMYFVFFKNKKAAHKEINSLSEINYKSNSQITFDDVAGNYEAKESMMDIVDFMKNPEQYKKFNIRVPKGIMLYGSPGTGKTLLAQALAGEAGVEFFAVSGSDFVQVYAGLGASRIRNLFKKANKAKKSVIFIDEIDAIGKKRQGGAMRGNDETDRTLNALLTEMSGFENSEIVVVAATNRLDTLDEALLRPGRFDRQIEIMLPDKQARKEILELYLKDIELEDDIDINKLAEMTVYFSGAKLENMVNEAKILAVKEKSEKLADRHLQKSYLTVIAGADQKRGIANAQDKKVTAYHEAGHAVVSQHLFPEDEIVKVSIIPTTKGAGGYTLTTPHNEMIISKKKIENRIKVLLAGRAAEEVFFGKENITVGAQNDIQRSTQFALDYATEYGMLEEIGIININILSQKINVNLEIESKIKSMIDELYSQVIDIINDNKEYIDNMVELLLEKETVSGVEIKKVCGI